jgi:hypothetical protein
MPHRCRSIRRRRRVKCTDIYVPKDGSGKSPSIQPTLIPLTFTLLHSFLLSSSALGRPIHSVQYLRYPTRSTQFLSNLPIRQDEVHQHHPCSQHRCSQQRTCPLRPPEQRADFHRRSRWCRSYTYPRFRYREPSLQCQGRHFRQPFRCSAAILRSAVQRLRKLG